MDLETLDRNPELWVLSSASNYEVSLALFHKSHGLPTPVSGDRKWAEQDHDRELRLEASKNVNIWKS